MKPHGDTGAYVGGDWVPIEECQKTFLCKGETTSCAKCPKTACPRSKSRNSAAKADGSYDIVVIGAGGVGAAIARELSKTTASVLLLEGADDVTQGATKGNSGIIHAGYDDKPGSVRSKFCPTGCRMFPQLDRELHFGFQKNTTLVVAKTKAEEDILKRLLQQGETNGVKNLRIIDRDELLEREPNVHPDCTQALLAEDAGTIIPYEFCVALAENAVDNGVELRIRRQVTDIQKTEDGFEVTAMHWEPKKAVSPLAALPMAVALGVASAALAFGLGGGNWVHTIIAFLCGMLAGYTTAKASSGNSSSADFSVEPSIGTKLSGPAEAEKIRTRYVVNAAGCQADTIAAMVGDTSFKVKERYGDYVLLHKREGKRVKATIFPCPDPVKGKGVLVQATIWGNLILGPTARDKADSQNDSKEDILHYIISKCRDLVPSFNAKEVIHTFCGARAKTTRGDWIIEPCPTAPKLIHAAGIDSPGLAASPAIALEVVRLLKEAGAPLQEDPTFNPLRAPIVVPKKGMKDAFGNAIRMGPQGAVKDPEQNVVCKCEKVTEAEVVTALRRSLPIDNTQAIRRRTRAGMGHCQGDPANYCCEDRVAAIIARETGRPLSEIQRRPWPGSSIMPQRFFTDADREWVEKSGGGPGTK